MHPGKLAFCAVVHVRAGTFRVVHARKAWLYGLSPKENRELPPLRYEDVRIGEELRPLAFRISSKEASAWAAGADDYTPWYVDASPFGRAIVHPARFSVDHLPVMPMTPILQSANENLLHGTLESHRLFRVSGKHLLDQVART